MDALSVQGSDKEGALRDRIVRSYSALLDHAPEFAPQVADQLHAWGSTELTETLSTIIDNGMSFALSEKQSVRRYLRSAAELKDTALVYD